MEIVSLEAPSLNCREMPAREMLTKTDPPPPEDET